MASTTSTVFLAISLVLLPVIVRSDFLSPIADDLCEQVECGKGTCEPSHNGTLLYECKCDPGWKQTRSDEDDHNKFLPCVVPNCTMDYSCARAPPGPPSPVEDKSRKANWSIFEPCHWMDCGKGGSCYKTSTFSYSCECDVSYYNLLNISTFPCFRDCSIGLDCKNLGISILNKSAPPTPIVFDNGAKKGSSVLQEQLYLWMILMVTLAILE